MHGLPVNKSLFMRERERCRERGFDFSVAKFWLRRSFRRLISDVIDKSELYLRISHAVLSKL